MSIHRHAWIFLNHRICRRHQAHCKCMCACVLVHCFKCIETRNVVVLNAADAAAGAAMTKPICIRSERIYLARTYRYDRTRFSCKRFSIETNSVYITKVSRGKYETQVSTDLLRSKQIKESTVSVYRTEYSIRIIWQFCVQVRLGTKTCCQGFSSHLSKQWFCRDSVGAQSSESSEYWTVEQKS